jgi:hypothetical protein
MNVWGFYLILVNSSMWEINYLTETQSEGVL